MLVKMLRLKNFGRFHNQDISLSPGINLLYGENESGKTTIFYFIKAMLFGMERQRGRGARFGPLNLYEPWENPSHYEGVMTFCAGGKNFRIERRFGKQDRRVLLINEDDGEELSVEQGDLETILDGLNENVFRNTMAVAQLQSSTDEGLADEVKRYTADISMSGDGSVDVAGALSSLKKQKKEWETAGKRAEEKEHQRKAGIEKEKTYIAEELSKKREQQAEYSRLYKERAGELKQLYNIQKAKLKRRAVAGLLLGAAAAGLTAFFVKRPSGFAAAAIIIGIAALAAVIYGKKGMNRNADEALERDGILQRLAGNLESLKEDIREKEIRLSNTADKIKETAEYEKEKNRIGTEIQALDLACERIEKASGLLQQQFSSEIDARASHILGLITNDKYTDIKIDDGLNMRLNTKDKLLYPAQVSKGTVEEMNFAVRMAFLELFFQDEPMPVLLDEPFAMYDDKRLSGALSYLAESGRQVLLCSCQSREKALLERMDIPFALIRLNRDIG